MKMTGNTILITGGGTDIGLAMAEVWLRAGSQVIVTRLRQEKLLDRGARSRREQEYRGIPPAEVAQAAIDGMARDELEIAIGQAKGLWSASPQEARQIFQRMNGG